MLSMMGRREDQRGGIGDRAFLAFQLHRFISGAGPAYATIEPASMRRVSLEGQLFHPDDDNARLYPLFFCRECGQEHHSVSVINDLDWTSLVSGQSLSVGLYLGVRCNHKKNNATINIT